MQDVKSMVRQYIQDNFIMGPSSGALADSDSFLEKHILDSTGFLEMIAYLEETFSIKVTDNEMVPENLDSLDSIAAFLRRKQQMA